MQTKFLAKALVAALLVLGASPALAAQEEMVNGRLSANWAGFVASRTTGYSAVGASWVVPKLSATTTLMTDAAWVGIGGSKSKDLIQAGTHSAVQNGTTHYWAWYELLPDYQKPIPLKVSGGDKVTVSLTELSEDLWYLSFVNDTTGAHHGQAFEYRSKNNSAEWIEEMPVVYNREGKRAYAPLSEFGTVTFTDAYAVVDGVRRSVEDLRASAVTMVSKLNKRIVLATPSEAEGGTFVVTRSGAVPSPASGKRADPAAIVWSKK